MYEYLAIDSGGYLYKLTFTFVFTEANMYMLQNTPSIGWSSVTSEWIYNWSHLANSTVDNAALYP